MKKKIAVLLGGISAERNVSLKTGKYVSQSLKKQGYQVKEIKVTANKKNLIKHISCIKKNINKIKKKFSNAIITIGQIKNSSLRASLFNRLISLGFNLPIIISTHPRTRKKLEEIGYEKSNKLIRFSKPYGFHEYNKLQMNAFCVISDSGTITEESSILNLPAITIREAHERPEGMDEGTLIMSGLNKERIIESIEVVTSQHKEDRVTKIVSDYDVDNVSMKVLRIILSYVDYINRTVWHKEI